MTPCEIADVSVPAQCTRPKGSRSRGPYFVRMPGPRCAIEQPRVHGLAHQLVSMNSTGELARGPNLATSASTTAALRASESSAANHTTSREYE
jgi:hypothetical protein